MVGILSILASTKARCESSTEKWFVNASMIRRRLKIIRPSTYYIDCGVRGWDIGSQFSWYKVTVAAKAEKMVRRNLPWQYYNPHFHPILTSLNSHTLFVWLFACFAPGVDCGMAIVLNIFFSSTAWQRDSGPYARRLCMLSKMKGETYVMPVDVSLLGLEPAVWLFRSRTTSNPIRTSFATNK